MASAKVGTSSARRQSARGRPPGPGELAVGEGQLARLGERDERGGAEPEFAASSADNEPLDPASHSGWAGRNGTMDWA